MSEEMVVIVAGGEAPPRDAALEVPPGAPVVAADGGVDHARALGLEVTLAIGDFDSVSPGGVDAAAAEGARVERHPAAKDATDLELALDAALDLEPARILVLAGVGERLDHLAAALLLLGSSRYAGVELDARIGNARLHVVRDRRTLHGEPGELVSLLPLHGHAEGVTTDGLVVSARRRDARSGFEPRCLQRLRCGGGDRLAGARNAPRRAPRRTPGEGPGGSPRRRARAARGGLRRRRRGRTTVVLVAHDSFVVSDDVKRAFERSSGLELQVLLTGDAGETLSKALLTAGDPQGDVLFGVDSNLLSRALAGDLFEPYEPPRLARIPPQYVLDPEHRVTPVDHGEVCLNYDRAWFAERQAEPPRSLDDLAQPEYAELLVVENPATSTPGLAFLLATIARYGDGGWQRYWRQLRENDVLVVDGWEEAYRERFSGAAGSRRRSSGSRLVRDEPARRGDLPRPAAEAGADRGRRRQLLPARSSSRACSAARRTRTARARSSTSCSGGGSRRTSRCRCSSCRCSPPRRCRPSSRRSRPSRRSRWSSTPRRSRRTGTRG